MTDTSTNQKLRVTPAGRAGSFITVPATQLATVRAILDGQRVPYSVDENLISLDDEPEVAFINLSSRVDATAVQDALDRHP